MPKTGIFDDNITFSSFMELREKITALGYLQGIQDFSEICRNLLTRAVQDEIDGLPDHKRREFEQIRQNVRAQMIIRRQQRAEKAMRKSP